jgi:long-subunit fatty acid transport protein
LWATGAAALGDVTIYDNAQSVPIGARAAGMGGAYTALACDEGALHYNPASLSCASSSHLELTANAYVVEGIRATGAFGPSNDISATTYHSIPSIVGAVRVLREGSEKTYYDTYPGRLTFGFTVSIPRTIALKIDPPEASQKSFAAFSTREDLTVGDLGLGYQINKEVSLGLSVGGVIRTSERHSQWLLLQPNSPQYVSWNDDRSSLALGGRVKLAALVRPYKNLSFGLVLTAPSFHLYGEAKEARTLADNAGADSVHSTGKSQVGMPGRAAIGFAYVKRRYTFSGDFSVNIPQHVKLAYGMSNQVADTIMTPLVQPNFNLGASVPFGTTKEVNIGFFTDISSVSDHDIRQLGLSRVHMFGSSLTIGFLGKQARAWVGLAGEIGHTTISAPGRSFTYPAVSALPPGQLPLDNEATLVRYTMTGILGSNYSFLE